MGKCISKMRKVEKVLEDVVHVIQGDDLIESEDKGKIINCRKSKDTTIHNNRELNIPIVNNNINSNVNSNYKIN